MSRQQFNHYILEELTDVRGGQGASTRQLQAPVKSLPQPKPFTPPTGMAPPKYSAGWWELVRKAGLSR